MPKPRKFHRRAFLNRKGYHSTACILAKVDSNDRKGYEYVSATFAITDCNRQIELDFDVYDAQSDAIVGNSLYKLDTLIEALVSFRSAFKDHLEYVRAAELAHKAAEE